ncbi:nuclear transport factor 2 family protein [Streptomyces sp. MB09-02B]|uniref:nuclear transport factor 2 family protein n=1 Tax=Streptomyces sp. MB09-02B TaxID=3028667 RepID=UPI0029A5E3D0|nr:nuclear transport factor 2 family protein [Streptomyces sp. MB09-02B]MDX3638578.1 nuclear transport factor 2 family protein [Streptomyces sp. MB09-02B]
MTHADTTMTRTTQPTGTTDTTETVIDRYLRLFDRSAHDPAAVEEILALFAPAATVRLFEGGEPVVGVPELRELYGAFAQGMVDSKHVWTTTVLDDGRLELRWLHASRRVDDRLVALSGIEYATLDADGLITNLDNRMVTPDNQY